MQRKDRYWKAIVHETLFDLIEYQYPATFSELDQGRPPEFLDKELRRVSLKGRQKGRVVDILARVWLKNGEERWILIYIEVQGYQDPVFELRMYTAHYRIFDHFGQMAISLAIFTDNNPKWHPKCFLNRHENSEVRYTFDTIKLLDESPERLRQIQNPFAIVLETAWLALAKNRLGDEHLAEVKFAMIRNLLRANYSKDKITVVLNFILDYGPLSDELKQRTFVEDSYQIIQKEPDMQTILELVTEDRAKRDNRINRKIEREKKQFAVKYAEKAVKKVTAELTKEVTEKNLVRHIENMLRKNFDPQVISEVLVVPIEKVLGIQSRLDELK